MLLSSLLLAAAALCGLAAIALERDEHRHRAFYVLKPLTTILILAAALPGAPGDYQKWVLAALAASLAGDICLMFSGERWFAAGLGSFLLAHLAFIAAFLQDLPRVDLPAWLAVVALAGAGMLAVLMPRAGVLRIPVLVYCTVLGAMVFAAAARYEGLQSRAAALALAGALMFMLSDSALGLRQFVRRYRHAQALILSTYWAGIGLIAASV